ncbi:MAG: hypothetical protein M0Z61_16450 [Nitrospiraceae bacterium]|nr:hypothetical protein [Nitrospiraceae bacterium]
MRIRSVFLFLLVLIAGCTYAQRKPVYNESSLISPLPAGLMVGPPIVESSPPADLLKNIRPLPPVLVVPGRNLYLYANVYYYYWDSDWFFSSNRQGPWYLLAKKNYPARVTHFQPGPQTPVNIETPKKIYPPFNR